jgi:M6 family metalloprotease-like protein
MMEILADFSRRKATVAFLALALLLVSVLSGSAQQNTRGARVRGMNNQLLELHSQARSNPGSGAALKAQAAEILQQRIEELEALIERDPAEALRVALPEDILSDLASSFPGARAHLESHGRWEGPIEYVVVDGEDFQWHRNLRTMRSGGETLSIQFAGNEPAGLQSGDILRVEGVRAGNQIAAFNGTTQTESVTTRGKPSSPPPCTTIGNQKSIVLMVTMPGADLPVDVTQAGVWDSFFNTGGSLLSLTDYWREASYGLTWATGTVAPGTSGGWYALDQVYDDTQTSQIRTAAIRAADPDVDFSQYSRVFLVINGMAMTQTWGGLGTIGCTTLSSNDGNFIASTSWIRSSSFATNVRGAFLAIHEAGHNLGLGHSNNRDFDAEALGALGAAGVVEEYGDVFSAMGRGTGHYSAPHKSKLGWFTSQVLTVTGNGTFALQPTELPGTVQALKIRRGTDPSKWVWVEYRQPYGIYDTRLAAPIIHGQVNYLDAADSHVYTGSLIHYEDETTGNTSHLLDMTPLSRLGSITPVIEDDWLDPPLAGTWFDPYTGLSITTTNPTTGALTVNVVYGAPACAAANPTVTISPPNPGGKRGQNVTYSVLVTNNDTAPCSSKVFDLSSTAPGGWATSFSQNSVTIAAGSSVSVSMTKAVPADAALGTVSVDATATSGTYSATGSASVTVKPGK